MMALQRDELGVPCCIANENSCNNGSEQDQSLSLVNDNNRDDHGQRNSSPVLNQSPPIFNLFPEIFTRIFKNYLTLKDRKNVRLTCRLWNEYSQDRSITQSEKFVYRSRCIRLSEVTKTIMKCDRVSLNLEFQDVFIYQPRSSPNLWKSSGSRVHTLHLLNCRDLSGTVLQTIFEQCVDLSDFLVQETYDPVVGCTTLLSTFENLLDSFKGKGIMRPKLHTLVIVKNTRLLKMGIISKIVSVFPSVRHFGIRSQEKYFLEHVPMERIENNLNLTRQQSFPISSPFFQTTGSDYLSSLLELSLTKLEMYFYIDCKNLASLFNFFGIWKNLNTLNLNVVCLNCSVCPSIKQLLFHIVEGRSSLRKLRFMSAYSTRLTAEETARFFASTPNLQCLMTDIFFYTQLTNHSLSLANSSLNTLSLRFCHASPGEARVDCFLLKHCSNIRHLKLHHPTDEILQETLKTMHDLKTLMIVQADNCTERGFIGQNQSTDENFSIQRLQKLEYLAVSLVKRNHFSMKITMDFVNEFQFSRLRYLRLEGFLDREETDVASILRAIMLNMPMLETLVLDKYSPYYVTEMINFCMCGNNLRRLGVEELPTTCSATMMPLFEACPNLRFVISRVREHEKGFAYDPLTKEILTFNRLHRHLQFPEDDGPFKVSSIIFLFFFFFYNVNLSL